MSGAWLNVTLHFVADVFERPACPNAVLGGERFAALMDGALNALYGMGEARERSAEAVELVFNRRR